MTEKWRQASWDEVPEQFGPACDDFRTICSNGFEHELTLGAAFVHSPSNYPQCFPGGPDSDAVCTGILLKKEKTP